MKTRIRPATLVCGVILAAAVIALLLLAPGAMDAKKMLEREQAATPTPTADVRSMLMVTIDPFNTPAPTPVLLKTGVKGDEVGLVPANG